MDNLFRLGRFFLMVRIVIGAMVLVLLGFLPGFAGSESPMKVTYINKADQEYLTLNPDGTFYLKLRKKPADLANPFMTATGRYIITGEDITLNLDDGGEASGKIKGNTFVDNEGKTWVKEGTSDAPPMPTDIKKGILK